jgi:Mrp family chromosome partitioning ATPase
MILASLADGVLFVVGHGETKKIHAARAIKYLARTRARVVGAVFSRIRTGPMGGLQFYFGKYYVSSVTHPADTPTEGAVEARLMLQERPT